MGINGFYNFFSTATTIKYVSELKGSIVLVDMSNILILEDDSTFDGLFKERIEYYTSKLPQDWDILYLGRTNSQVVMKALELTNNNIINKTKDKFNI